jgi:hypothetical protein
VPVHRARLEIRHEEALDRHDLAQQHARRRAIAVPVEVRAGDVHVECRRYEHVVSRRPVGGRDRTFGLRLPFAPSRCESAAR